MIEMRVLKQPCEIDELRATNLISRSVYIHLLYKHTSLCVCLLYRSQRTLHLFQPFFITFKSFSFLSCSHFSEAHIELMKAVSSGMYEYELEGIFRGYCARRACRLMVLPLFLLFLYFETFHFRSFILSSCLLSVLLLPLCCFCRRYDFFL